MATILNFFGIVVMTAFNASVAMTIYNMVDFGGDSSAALVALCAALFAIVLWAVAAWWFGIPTSESHALIAGISGAAIALQGGLSGINGGEWIKVVYGLFFSAIMGFGLGFLVVRVIELICRNIDRRKTLGFSAGRKLPARAPWPLCTARKTAKNSWGSFCWGSFWQKARAM